MRPPLHLLSLLMISRSVWAAPKQPPTCGPPVEQVVAAALERAGLDGSQERSWRTRLGWSALLPRVTGVVGESHASGEVVDPRYALSSSSIKNYLAQQWQVRATWDLSRLVFDTRELRVAGRARRTAIQRRTLLEHVVRLYFDRCRLLLSEGMIAATPEQKLQQDLELRRLTALLDGLCGGLFSGARWP
jgi:hypothetical protein